MVVSIVYHDLDNDILDHLIFPLVENNHLNKGQIVVKMMDTLAFHNENMSVMATVVVNMVNET
jgi:hypothetical protein